MDNQKGLMQKCVSILLTNVSLLLLQFSAVNSHACGSGGITITNLATLGGSSSQVYALNNAGQITGYSFLSGDLTAHAFRFVTGIPADLGTLGGSVSEGFAINASGEIAGDSNTAD